MPSTKYWSINEFAKFAYTTNSTLIHYDKIGLLLPAFRGSSNNYRYYHSRQLPLVNLANTCRRLGMTLGEVKTMKDIRTPEVVDEFLTQHVKKIDARIDEWVSAKKLLLSLQRAIHSALNIDENVIEIKHMPAEAIILGDINDYSEGKDEYDALSDFYYNMKNRYPGIETGCPVGAHVSEDRIKAGDWSLPDRYYFSNPEGNDRKPAAFYAIGYKRGDYGQGDALYKRMAAYIDEQGFEICGDAYEEYPFNEVSIVDQNNYLMRVMIIVREKGSRREVPARVKPKRLR